MASGIVVCIPVLTLLACGSSKQRSHIVAVIAGAAITEARLEHIAAVLASAERDRGVAESQSLQRMALQSLISSEWLIGEAKHRGVSASHRDVERWISMEFPGGDSELESYSRVAGVGLSDIRFAAEVEIAATRLGRDAVKSVPKGVAHEAVDAYYKAHIRRFMRPERRMVAITNRKTRAEASIVKRELLEGVASRGALLQLSYTRSGGGKAKTRAEEKDDAERAPLEDAVFSAKLRTVTGPIHMRRDYFVFEVRRIEPRRVKSLAQGEAMIVRQIHNDRVRAALGAFLKSWRRHWTKVTDCVPSVIVPGCRQAGAQSRAALAAPISLGLRKLGSA